MSKPRAPSLDQRRESDFQRELLARARQWIPLWQAQDSEPDFAQALLAIAARFDAEVAERLDRGGDKMARGFLDWLAIRGRAAVPARMPVVFKLADGAPAVSAPAPVKLQADGLTFETDTDVRLIPGRLEMVVGADPEDDAYYLPPPSLSSLDPLAPLPAEWQLTSFAAPGASTLQLDPALGLEPGMLVEIQDQQFQIVEVKDNLVRIDPAVPPGPGFAPDTGSVRKVAAFTPFGGSARNQQLHAVYLGDPEYLDITAQALIEVGGVAALGADTAWHYWGKRNGDAAVGWQPFTPPSAGAALNKPEGSIEPRQIGGLESRWIRASLPKAHTPGFPALAEAITLTINPGDLSGECGPDNPENAGVGDLEAMSNSTPLELNDIFFPLGREPRQFDTFYLGSAEAFSKRGATVRICVDISDSSFESFACLRVSFFANMLLGGVAQDGTLHLFLFDPSSGRLSRFPNRHSLRPPSPAPNGGPGPGLPVTLDPQPHYRPALWSSDQTFPDIFITVASKGAVWLWHESIMQPFTSGWSALGMVVPGSATAVPIDGLVFLSDGGQGKLFALTGQALYLRAPLAPDIDWTPVPVKLLNVPVKLAKIAPIGTQGSDLGAGSIAEGLLGIGDDGTVYQITLSGTPLTGACTRLFGDADTSVAPAGVRRADGALVAVAVAEDLAGDPALHGWISTAAVADQHATLGAAVIGHSIDANLTSGQLVFALSLAAADGAAPSLAWWSPFDPVIPATLFSSAIPEAVGTPAGSPALLARHVVVPASLSQVLVAEFDLARQRTFYTTVKSAVITALSDQPYQQDDSLALAVTAPGNLVLRKIAAAPAHTTTETLYQPDSAFGGAQSGNAILAYRSSGGALQASLATLTTLELPAADSTTQADTRLLVKTDQSIALYRVASVTAATPRVATLASALDVIDPTAPPAGVDYWLPHEHTGRIAPLLALDPATSGNWDAALLDRTPLVFPGAVPDRQRAVVFSKDAANHPVLVALEHAWTTPPAQPARVLLDASVDKWSAQLGDTTANPELSWEYWNGTAWWKLTGLRDETLNLKRSGAIRFDIPTDLQPTDWSGKTNQWIRARLIGGDYGQPRSIVKTVPKAGGVTEQTIERVAGDVSAPQVLRLRVQYAANAPVRPRFVLTADNGAMRDQSDANRVPGAMVTMFNPLSSALSPAAPGRAIYLGFSAELAGEPVNLLVLVEKEKPHAALAPLNIEAVSGERLVPVVAEDTTRALGESGLLSMSLTVPPLNTGLFGRSLCWLRLSPRANAEGGSWEPSLRGVYLNAVWAHAAETMTRERLGSSTGAPGQQFQLARPPVLQDTLVLRVREALSAEERAALLAAAPHSVVSDVADDLRGDWVLWRQVTDPADCGPAERVYGFDEASGEVQFGDGLHGAIPPIGRDAIVAFSYQRTEPETVEGVVAANLVAPRTSLNLVTPVEGVELALAADQSAGGAPPDSAQRVLRFAPAQLRHRGRALTSRDFEELAMQSSPDIAQARAFRETSGIRLVVAMRGQQVQPGQAARRELQRALLALAPAGLAMRRSLRITGPVVRRLRITLRLRVAGLDASGALAAYAKRRLHAFFDTASGGMEQDGWPLGAAPAEDDIALALLDAPRLDGIEAIAFSEIAADGQAAAWRPPVRPDQLVQLDGDGVRIEFVIVEIEQ